ncbi:ankyrin repeat domain-containing protein [Spiroplasma endosymbiont of Melieria omissa]|uniref:ankyrin repeat domain-containing protein n=2 Tax=Spiroplasma endosymbiont of Melieria omissa TaxID=3139324 RepID=UPI003CCB0CE6
MSNLKEISKLNTTININKNEKLIKGAKHDDLELTQTLLKNNADVNYVDEHHNSPLTIAAEHGNLKIVQILLKNNANINHINDFGDDALRMAAKKGYTEVVNALLATNSKNLFRIFLIKLK